MSLIEVVPVGTDWFHGRRVWKLTRMIWRGYSRQTASRLAGIDPRQTGREIARLKTIRAIPSRPCTNTKGNPR